MAYLWLLGVLSLTGGSLAVKICPCQFHCELRDPSLDLACLDKQIFEHGLLSKYDSMEFFLVHMNPKLNATAIGHFVDLSQLSKKYLEEHTQLPPATIAQLQPYLGLKGNDARFALQSMPRMPVNDKDVNMLQDAFLRIKLKQAEAAYNIYINRQMWAKTLKNAVCFADLKIGAKELLITARLPGIIPDADVKVIMAALSHNNISAALGKLDSFSYLYQDISTVSDAARSHNDATCIVETGPVGYLGCREDDQNRNLDYFQRTVSNNGLTIMNCIKTCLYNGYTFAAVQNSAECWCDYKYAGAVKSDSECNMRCSGNRSQFCGGPWRNQVYSTLAHLANGYRSYEEPKQRGGVVG